MGLAGKRLESYMGSQHSAVGFLLALLGVFALGIGALLFSVPAECPRWVAVSILAWAVVGLPLGVSMRLRRPRLPLWILANLLLGIALLTLLGAPLLGR